MEHSTKYDPDTPTHKILHTGLISCRKDAYTIERTVPTNTELGQRHYHVCKYKGQRRNHENGKPMSRQGT